MRRFSLILFDQVRSFTRRVVWPAWLAAGLAGTLVIFWYVCSRNSQPILYMSQTVYGQAILTLTFMMMGIELRREHRREHLDDLIAACPCPPSLLPLAQIAAIAVMVAAVTLIVEAGCLVPLVMDHAPRLWLRQTALQIVLLYFLPCLIMGLWGLLISHLRPGKGVYFPAILVWLLTSSLSVYFTGSLSRELDGWRLVSGFLNLGFDDFHIPRNLVTGLPIERPRWVVRIVIALFLAILYVSVRSGRRAATRARARRARIVTGAALLCGTALLTCLCVRYAPFYLRFANDAVTQDLTWGASRIYKAGEPASLADYPREKRVTLRETDIDLACTTRGLEAEVTLRATMDREAESQSFTLFSGLTVDEVFVDDTAADYERSHDGLLVHFPERKAAGEEIAFTFVYHGFSLPSYPVNETTVQLHQSFPWFPWPGIKTVAEEEISLYNMSQVFFLADWQREDAVDYTLRYRGPGDLYTNLEEAGGGMYTGTSAGGVALYSGMIHTDHRGVDGYVPASLYKDRTVSVDALLDSYEPLLDYCERMGAPVLPQRPASVVVIQARGPMWGKVFARPNELYSRGDLWEIRMRNDSSSVIGGRSRASSREEYQADPVRISEVVVPYLLNLSAGYPVDAPEDATDCFADLMTLYIRADELDADLAETYSARLYERYQEDPAVCKRWIDAIVAETRGGRDLDEPLRAVYQRLLRAEEITPADVFREVYDALEG